MNKVKQEIMSNLFKELLDQLESSNNLDNFVSMIEQVMIEAVVSFSDGDIKCAANILEISQKGLEQKLSKDFGGKDVADLYVLAKRMRKNKLKVNQR